MALLHDVKIALSSSCAACFLGTASWLPTSTFFLTEVIKSFNTAASCLLYEIAGFQEFLNKDWIPGGRASDAARSILPAAAFPSIGCGGSSGGEEGVKAVCGY